MKKQQRSGRRKSWRTISAQKRFADPDRREASMTMMRLLMFVLLACVGAPAMADNVFQIDADLESGTVNHRRMLLCCGLPGDDRHREQMTEACRRIIGSAQVVLGVQPENLVVLAGDEEMQSVLQSDHAATEICTRETMIGAIAQAADKLGPTDAFWCILIGHSHPYGSESQFNVSGKDLNQGEFAKAAAAINCREQVFWLTQPISGFWIRPLARPGRIIVTATEADLEFTGTEMPYALAAVMAGESENQPLDDIDGDGTLSFLDLYLATNLEITERFRAIDRLQTEHAQLDDNGDGRGSEVQQPYLPVVPKDEDEGDKEKDEEESPEEEVQVPDETEVVNAETQPKPPLIQSRNLDGFRSRYVLISKPNTVEPKPKSESQKPESETTADNSVETASS
ncbi:MAG: hypothetical protein KDB00_01790 [Planctomycetales bacterium]|nr:hypothetical protein [Planctomycetales bacterium]